MLQRPPSQYGGPAGGGQLQHQDSRRMNRSPSAYGGGGDPRMQRPPSQMERQMSQRPPSHMGGDPRMQRPPSQMQRGQSQMQRQGSQRRPNSQMQRGQSQLQRPPSQMQRGQSQMGGKTLQRPPSQMMAGDPRLQRPPSSYAAQRQQMEAANAQAKQQEEDERAARLTKYESETVFKSAISAKKKEVVEEEITQEVMRVFLRNQAYKSLVITSVTKAGDVCMMMAEKLGLERFACEFDVIECVKGNEKRVDPGTNIMRLKKAWPTILGQAGNETDKHCKLIVAPKRGASSDVQNHYRNAMYGK